VRLAITGGGTGGHLYPALAVLEALGKAGPVEALFIGTRSGLESKIVPPLGIPFETVWISGLRRGRLAGNLLFPVKMAVSFFQARRLLGRFKPDAAVGTGGYVSWPVIRAASSLGLYTVIQEQNESPGLVTRLLARRADQVHLSFESSKRHFRRQSNLHVSGNPTRANLESPRTEAAYRQFGLDPARPTLFLFGGSQGSRSLNEAMLRIAPRLVEASDAQVLWAAGESGIGRVRAKLPESESRIRALPYITDMGAAYAVTDAVVCRAGAGAVAEIARLGLPAVLVPFAQAAGGHQEANAKVLDRAGAAILVPDGADLAARLEPVLVKLATDPEARRILSQKVRAFGRPDAADAIVRTLLEGLACQKR
jgi:UDP-N-acetylglucosamine--N-acetylmuramyl-(pentapeptide) pyrophosphoryl-undecaprenol N-acetylglucosamine transferase